MLLAGAHGCIPATVLSFYGTLGTWGRAPFPSFTPWAAMNHPAHRGPSSSPLLGLVLRGKAKLPRGFRFTMVFSSFEKQSRLGKSVSCLPGEKHSTQLSASSPLLGHLGARWGQP